MNKPNLNWKWLDSHFIKTDTRDPAFHAFFIVVPMVFITIFTIFVCGIALEMSFMEAFRIWLMAMGFDVAVVSGVLPQLHRLHYLHGVKGDNQRNALVTYHHLPRAVKKTLPRNTDKVIRISNANEARTIRNHLLAVKSHEDAKKQFDPVRESKVKDVTDALEAKAAGAKAAAETYRELS